MLMRVYDIVKAQDGGFVVTKNGISMYSAKSKADANAVLQLVETSFAEGYAACGAAVRGAIGIEILNTDIQ